MHVGERHGLNAKDSGRPNLQNSQNQAKLAVKKILETCHEQGFLHV